MDAPRASRRLDPTRSPVEGLETLGRPTKPNTLLYERVGLASGSSDPGPNLSPIPRARSSLRPRLVAARVSPRIPPAEAGPARSEPGPRRVGPLALVPRRNAGPAGWSTAGGCSPASRP